jgi:hypothetical protein
MNCQGPTAEATERACGLKPLSTKTRCTRSVGTPSFSRMRFIESMYCPERTSQRSNVGRPRPVK